jgi:hypothetical protein
MLPNILLGDWSTYMETKGCAIRTGGKEPRFYESMNSVASIDQA